MEAVLDWKHQVSLDCDDEKVKKLVRLIYRTLAVRGPVQLGKNVHIGFGSRIWAPSAMAISQDVYIGKYCTIECNGSIGAGSIIANGVGLVGRSDHDIHQIGTAIRFASWVGDTPRLETSIIIGEDCWIGYGATVLGSVTIGDSSIIAAGALVLSDVPENSICVGVPARVLRNRFSIEEYDEHKARLARARVLK